MSLSSVFSPFRNSLARPSLTSAFLPPAIVGGSTSSTSHPLPSSQRFTRSWLKQLRHKDPFARGWSRKQKMTRTDRSIRKKFQRFTPHVDYYEVDLPSGATFVYNPPSSEPSVYTTTVLSGLKTEEVNAPSKGKKHEARVLPSGWTKPVEYASGGKLASSSPRVDKQPEGYQSMKKADAVTAVGGESVVAEILKLRAENPKMWSLGALSKKYNVHPHTLKVIGAKADENHKEFIRQREEHFHAQRHWKKQMTMEARKIRRTYW